MLRRTPAVGQCGVSTLRLFGRAVLLRCPRCGRGGIAHRWTLAEHCPACGHRYERHEGYWVGAVAVNTIATIGLFFAVFVGGMVLTWPDVPWNVLLVVTVALNLVFPIVFYPWSKTIWIALDLAVHPPDQGEVAAAAERAGAPPP